VNMESMFGTSDFGDVIVQEVGGPPWKDNRKLRKLSPLTYAEKIRTPLLIIHSEQDLRCALEQAEQLFLALKYLNREVEYVAFEGESHGLSRGGRPQNRCERLKRIIGWFDKHMK
jgi:dipeptidyl aminopeptidase/acylaminoacyl peptidase